MSVTFLFLGILSLLAGMVVSGFLYFRQQEVYSRGLIRLLFVLRSLALATLLFALIAPFINYKTKELNKAVVAVLLDNSASMLLSKDSLLIKNELYGKIQDDLGGMDAVEMRLFSFDEKLGKEVPDFGGSASDISNAIKKAAAQIDRDRLAAYVLVSDGIVNRGINPLYEIEKNIVPIFTVAVGDSARQKDLAVIDVRAPEYVFRGDEIFIEATISAENATNFEGKVELFENGSRIASQKLKVENSAFAKVYSFKVEAKKPGLLAFEVRVSSAPEERNLANNAKQFLVEVIENRIKIAVISSAPSPDVAALREALKKLEAYEVSYFNAKRQEAIPQETELAVVFLQPFASPAEIQAAIQNYKGPLWVIVDPLADGRMFTGELDWLGKIGRPQGILMKPNLNDSFGLFKLSSESAAAMKKLEPVAVFTGTIKSSGSMEALFTDSQGKPVASYGIVGERRVTVFNFSGLWKLRMNDFKQNKQHKFIDEWLQLSAQFLTATGSGNRLKVRYEKLVASAAEIDISAEVYDAAYQMVRDANVNLELTNEEGEKFNYSFAFQNNEYRARINQLKPGKYTFTASAKLGDEELTNRGAFFVESQSLEARNTRANYDLLMQMAEISGGDFYTLQDIAALKQDLENQRFLQPIESIKVKSIALIDLKWIFALVVLLLAAEWLLRRYFGSI